MATFTVYFESPWWIGVLEIEDEDGLRAHRIVFGPEPNWPTILEVITKKWKELRATRAVAVEVPRIFNPKRAARELAKQARTGRPSTKAQEALAASREQIKKDNCASSKEMRETAGERKREIAKRKALKKRRGH